MLYLPNPAIATIINLVGSPTFVCVLGCRMLVHLKEQVSLIVRAAQGKYVYIR